MSSPKSQQPPKGPNAQLIELQKPEKLSQILKDDKYDCLSCRLAGKIFAVLCQRMLKLNIIT